MPFVGLGYPDEARWQAPSEGERAAPREDGFDYDAELRRGGHLVGSRGLRSVW